MKTRLARLRNALGRGNRGSRKTRRFIYEEIYIDPRRHEVKIGGVVADLTSTEFKILHFFTRLPGWVFTRAQIVDAVHGTDYPVTDRSVEVQRVSLRRKLGGAEKYLETVRGVGYRFKVKM